MLNMIAESLCDDHESIVVLSFNPWLFEGTEDVMTRFFGELSAQIGRGRSEKLKKVAFGLLKVGASLASASQVPGAHLGAVLASAAATNWEGSPSLLDTRNELSDALRKSESKVVVLVDNID